jgi:hypothetical protein
MSEKDDFVKSLALLHSPYAIVFHDAYCTFAHLFFSVPLVCESTHTAFLNASQ